MAKTISIVTIIALISISLSCQSNTGSSVILPVRTTTPNYGPGPVSATAGEMDIVEVVIKNRIDYQKSLEALVSYYTRAGNNEKLNWASKELKALNSMPQYDYYDAIITADRSPTTQILDADLLYNDAMLEKQRAEQKTLLFIDKNLERSALGKFKQLITNYGKSDKIDDAAYQAGEICENLNDYTKAIEFYKAVYTWDTETRYPARLRAARLLDLFMHNYSEALPLYREGVEKEGKYEQNRERRNNAEERIKVLEKTVK